VADMTIGELAAAAGVGTETIRYYERKLILPPPRRARSGYRQYDGTDVWRLAFVRRAKTFGFTLREIAELLGAGEDRSVDEVRRLTRGRLHTVERDLAVLTRRRDDLRRLLTTCDDGAAEDCLGLASN
jgi:DNA-binding transcriptional MerR regulator